MTAAATGLMNPGHLGLSGAIVHAAHGLFVPDVRAAPGSGLLLLRRRVMVRLSWPRHAVIAVLLRYRVAGRVLT